MRCFEGNELSILKFKSLLHPFLDWNTAFNSLPCSNLFDMLEHCNLRD